jgi:hypothetical protein
MIDGVRQIYMAVAMNVSWPAMSLVSCVLMLWVGCVCVCARPLTTYLSVMIRVHQELT